MRLESLYQEVILDHYRHPHHKGLREPYDAEVHHVNPLCGDEVTLRVALKDATGEPVVADVSYDALGCSISQASASVMSELIIGKTVPEAMSLAEEFLRLMQSKGQTEPDEEILGDGGGVRRSGQVPGPDQVRPARLDGLEGRDRASAGGTDMTDGTGTSGPLLEITPETEDLLEALRDVVDPELGVNVVDLGPRLRRDAGRGQDR